MHGVHTMKKSIVVIIGIIVVSLFLFSLNQLFNNELHLYEIIDTQTVEAKKQDNEDFIIYLYQEQCAPCEQVRPIINEYIEDNNVDNIYAVDVNNSDNVLNSVIDYEITMTPTIISFTNGNEAQMIEGAFTQQDFESFNNESFGFLE